ncbi:6914_t:CDS:2 [Entrophospora sp. SA101]|nr:6914_t:CDS:2 [Entrophospora sp. SA101]
MTLPNLYGIVEKDVTPIAAQLSHKPNYVLKKKNVAIVIPRLDYDHGYEKKLFIVTSRPETS